MKTSQPIAAIDIGSNSVFLQIVEVVDGEPGDVLSRVKHRARLGAAIGEDGSLSESAVEATVTALRGFKAVIDRYDAQVYATATAAVRKATNGGVLLAKIRDVTDIDVHMISGRREAELVLLGVTSGLKSQQRLLCADVGGGSSEVFVGQIDGLADFHGIGLGAVTLSHPHLMRAPVTDAAMSRARQRVASALADVSTVIDSPWDVAIATSGTAQRVARIVRALRGEKHQKNVDGERFGAADLAQIRALLVSAQSHSDRLAVPGIDPDRADVLLGGILIFEGLTEALGIDSWRVSMAGLRMGLVHQALRLRGEC